MKPIVSTVTVQRPRDEVFAFLDVLGNHEQFTNHFLVDWSLSAPASGLGAKARMRTNLPGPADWADMEVVEVVAPERIVERAVGAGGKRRSRGTYFLEPEGSGATRVRFELVIEELPASARLLAPLAGAWLRRANDKALRRMAETLETAGSPSVAAA
jgi:uncharacterized protein YndB with AHSA1/START domain